MAKRWKQRPEGSTWGDFGEDDQLGRLNLLTAEKVLEGVREIREGRTFSLSDFAVQRPGRSTDRKAPLYIIAGTSAEVGKTTAGIAVPV